MSTIPQVRGPAAARPARTTPAGPRRLRGTHADPGAHSPRGTGASA
ncbi:hypothetical protein AB0H71_26700 [Nocardia sp. NPDC050697]